MTNSETAFDSLLVRLNSGDWSAAEVVFQRFEPYLRMIVRRQISGAMQSKFNSSDIVQSVWVDLLQGFRKGRWKFDDVGHLQAFLVKVTQNRFLDRIRQQRTPLQHERALTVADESQIAHDRTPRASQEVRLVELWSEITKTCSEPHRVLLELKRQGKSLGEIAAQTGYHESSIRRILYDLARQFVANHSSNKRSLN